MCGNKRLRSLMHLVGAQRKGERVDAGVGHDPSCSWCRNHPVRGSQSLWPPHKNVSRMKLCGATLVSLSHDQMNAKLPKLVAVSATEVVPKRHQLYPC